MALLEVQVMPVPAGEPIDFVDATSPDTFEGNTGLEYVYIKQADGGSVTVTVAGVADPYGAVKNLVVTVPENSVQAIGPLRPLLFNSNAAGLVTISYNDVSRTEVAIVRHP